MCIPRSLLPSEEKCSSSSSDERSSIHGECTANFASTYGDNVHQSRLAAVLESHQSELHFRLCGQQMSAIWFACINTASVLLL